MPSLMVGTIPRNWRYYGPAKLIVDSEELSIDVSMSFELNTQFEVNLDILYGDISIEEIRGISQKLDSIRQQIIIIPSSIFLTGHTYAPFIIGNEIRSTKFYPYELVTYSTSNIPPEVDNFIKVAGYLNDEVSSVDRDSGLQEEKHLRSGYKIACGKRSFPCKEYLSSSQNNIETVYNFSFLELTLNLEHELSKQMHTKIQGRNIEESVLMHLENAIRDSCYFLSVLSKKKIEPMYYEYIVRSQDRLISGKLIPIIGGAQMNHLSKSRVSNSLHFSNNISDFLECFPLHRQLSKGIQHLAFTSYESTFELKLLTACSAIEFFYSYWLRELDGFIAIENMSEEDKDECAVIAKKGQERSKISQKHLKQAKSCSQKGMTPFISIFIRFFLKQIGIKHTQYRDEDFAFLEVRNNILHGTLIYEDRLIIESEQLATALAQKILMQILKKISPILTEKEITKFGNNLYQKLPVNVDFDGISSIPKGWTAVQDLFEELSHISPQSKYWDYEYKDFYDHRNIKQ